MTERQVQTAINGGIPFVINMTDGRKFAVPDASRITLGTTSVVVVDDDGTPHLLSIAGIASFTFSSPGR